MPLDVRVLITPSAAFRRRRSCFEPQVRHNFTGCHAGAQGLMWRHRRAAAASQSSDRDEDRCRRYQLRRRRRILRFKPRATGSASARGIVFRAPALPSRLTDAATERCVWAPGQVDSEASASVHRLGPRVARGALWGRPRGRHEGPEMRTSGQGLGHAHTHTAPRVGGEAPDERPRCVLPTLPDAAESRFVIPGTVCRARCALPSLHQEVTVIATLVRCEVLCEFHASTVLVPPLY